MYKCVYFIVPIRLVITFCCAILFFFVCISIHDNYYFEDNGANMTFMTKMNSPGDWNHL